MNWYSVFYWITVADGIKDLFDWMSNLFTFLTIIFCIVYVLLMIAHAEAKNKQNDEVNKSDLFWIKNWRRLFIWSMVLAFVSWAGYVAVPTKKDALMIVAGGAVGQFITTDSSAKQIPSEVMLLLRTKIRSEIEQINGKTVTDTLANKSKEELLEIIRQKQ